MCTGVFLYFQVEACLLGQIFGFYWNRFSVDIGLQLLFPVIWSVFWLILVELPLLLSLFFGVNTVGNRGCQFNLRRKVCEPASLFGCFVAVVW
jgi:hypothetical protein